MIHIMAGVYVVSFLISSVMSLLYIWSMKKYYQSAPYLNLNSNLASLGLYWSDSQSEILPALPQSIYQDQSEAIKSFSRVALLASFTSIIGCLFLSLFIFSIRKVAKPRLEKKILASKLAQQIKLDPEEIKEIVLSLQAEFGLNRFQLN